LGGIVRTDPGVNNMKFILAIFSFLLLNISLCAQVGNLIWEDNFTGSHLDLSKWNYEKGTGVNGDWGTGQLDRATDRLENVSFQDNVTGAENGCLAITTRKENYIDRSYTSGRITTAGKASWGPGHRIVARIFPRDVKYKGQGFAFWMMPDEIPAGWSFIMWPQGGEIDIMEYVGSIPFHNLGSVHYAWFWQNNEWTDWNHGHQGAYYSFESKEVPDPSEPGHGGYPPEANDPNAGSAGFHTYGIDWYNDRIEFFVDDNVYHIHYLNDGGAWGGDGEDWFGIKTINSKRVAKSEYSNHFKEWHPFEHKMYAILSAGVGGGLYTYGGAIVPDAEFPCTVFVDWIRVYELDIPVGLDENLDRNKLLVYPNPASDKLNIRFNNPKNYIVKIIDSSGKTLINKPLDQSSEIDVSQFSRGVYLVLVSDGKFSMSKKIILK
jgi:beta-glucanase (GH16 family)